MLPSGIPCRIPLLKTTILCDAVRATADNLFGDADDISSSDGETKRATSRDGSIERGVVRLFNTITLSVPARLGKGQGAREIGHNLAREQQKFGHNLVRKRHKIGHSLERE